MKARYKTLAIAAAVAWLGLGCASEEPETTPTSPFDGKGDVAVTPEACEAHFASFEPCPETDDYSATLEELNASIACLEDLQHDPVWTCCELDELKDGSFCTARLEEGRDEMCRFAYDSYNECAVDELFNLGACRNTFLQWDDGWDCCSRRETNLCDGPHEPTPIVDIWDFTKRMIDADGYFYHSDLFDQMFPVDILPQEIEDNNPLYQQPYANNWLAADEINIDTSDPDWREKLKEQETRLTLHEIAERLPISYAIRGFGEASKDDILEADAYIAFWRTTEGRIAISSHYYDVGQLGTPTLGWTHGPTFVLGAASACETLSAAEQSAPDLGAMSFVLDEANGHPDESCLAGMFRSVDPASLGQLEAKITSYYFTAGDDSTINSIERAHQIDTPGFSGMVLELVSVPSQETVDLLGEDYIERRTRVLINEHDEIVHKWDDEWCEDHPYDPASPRCSWDL